MHSDCIILNRRLCGIDFGLKNIGLSISNSKGTIATSLCKIENKGFRLFSEKLAQIIFEYKVGGFVVGWPLLPNGDQGTQCTLVNNFIQKLHIKFKLPVHKMTETYSTQHCQAYLYNNFGIKFGGRKKISDAIVATYLLQTYLDEHSNLQSLDIWNGCF